jgi:redox-sensitive bicupin YhaK (pirin superfamily)
MITLCRSSERGHERLRLHESWHTFHSKGALARGFGDLALFDENRLPPVTEVQAPRDRDAEVVTYVREGSVAYEDSTGRSGVVHAGEFDRATVGAGLRHRQTNASRVHWAQVFQIWLRPSTPHAVHAHEQKRFSAADRHGGFCVVASTDARRGSLRLDQDAVVYSALLDPGQHVVLALAQGRGAWLHVVQGGVTLDDLVLTTGDGVGVTGAPAVSLTARETTEILLVDVGGRLPSELALVS